MDNLLKRIFIAIDKIESSVDQMVYRDLFALRCYLNIKGKKDASAKAIRTVCKAVGEEDMVKKLLEHINDNEREFAEKIWAHKEIFDLLDNNAS